jgi:sugar phosphate isomerase/epimerase
MSDREAMEHMRLIYSRIIPVAEAYGVGINIEPHGYYSSRPEFMEEMLSFSNSPYLRMNMDTGNVFMAGHNPVAFLQRFLRKVSHVHAKDVTPTVAAARGREQTGIAVSQCALGDGVNAENIRACVERLVRADYNGVVSINCEGHGGPMIERSLAWLRGIVNLTWEEAQVAVHA